MNYAGKLAIQQRVLPPYRAAFFDLLARSCDGGLSVCAGLPRPEESIAVTDSLLVAHYFPIRNIRLVGAPFDLYYQTGLPGWLSGWNPDALIVEANPHLLSTPRTVRWMKRGSRPVIGWGLGSPPLTGPLASLRRSQRISFLRPFDALLTYSRCGADEYAALGFPTERIFVASNAAVPRPAYPMPSRPEGFKERPNILFVGRLQARKRVDILLRACASLAKEIQPRLVIVGDGPERAALDALAKEIYPSAELPGAKHGTELAPYFSSADLFVLPGTGGLAVQEAMSYGLPVIMGQGDGTNDDLVRPHNGWRIPSDNLEALTATLSQALSDAGRLRAMGAESYRIVSEEINLEKMVGVFVETLNSL